MSAIAILGAAGAIGEAAARIFAAAGCTVRAGMRRYENESARRLAAAGAELHPVDLDRPAGLAAFFAGADAAILTPNLSKSTAALPFLANVPRTVFFSSNNVAIDADDPIYASLRQAEARIRAALPRATILRPTLIYGDPRLPAIPSLMRVMRRAPLMPVPGGRALQQPIFHEDVARVAAHAAMNDHLAGLTLALGGPEQFSLAELYRRVSHAVGGARLIVPTPPALLAAMRACGLSLPIGAAQLARANRDKLAIAVDPLPPDLAPATPFAEGLARLLAAGALAADARNCIETPA